MDLSIVVPVYNGAKSIIELMDHLDSNLKDLSFEVIFVDDCSCDESYKVIERLASEYDQVIGIKLEENFGQQNATYCGLRESSGDYVITIDDDLQHPDETILELYQTLQKGYDCVYGIYEYEAQGYRRLGSWMRDFLFNYLIGKPKDLNISSYRIMKRELVDKICLCEYDFIYISALILKETQNIGNVLVNRYERKYGRSGYNFRKLIKLYTRTFMYYSKFSRKKDKEGVSYVIEKTTSSNGTGSRKVTS